MAPAAQYDEVEVGLVTVPVVGVVVNVQARVAFPADLAAVPGPSQRGGPPCLPLGLHPVLSEGHLPKLRGPRLPGEPTQALPLAMELEAQVGAEPAQQGREYE